MNRSQLLQMTMVTLGATAAVSVGAVPVTFSGATATYFQTFDRLWSPAEMIDGITSGTNGWAIFRNTGGADQTLSETALFTLATPVAAGNQTFTFTIHQNYADSFHELGNFRLSYTTAVAPTLVSTATPMNIVGTSATSGATFTSPSAGELLVGGVLPATDVYTVTTTVTSAAPITGVFLSAINNPANGLPTGGPGRQPANGNFVLSEFTASVVPEPGSLAMMVMGIAVVLICLKRDRL